MVPQHLMLHGLRKVLDLCHGYPMSQAYKVYVDDLEHPLRIHTHDVISYSPLSMMRESIRLSWSNICIHVIDCHYVSSHQNMSFESIYQKTQKKLIIQKTLKRGFGIRYQCHRMLLLVVGACRDLPGNLSPHRGNHRWQLSVIATMERNQLDRGWTPYLHLVCASHLPNVVGLDLEPCEEERQL